MAVDNVTIPKPLTSGATDSPDAPQGGASDLYNDLPPGYAPPSSAGGPDLYKDLPPGYSRPGTAPQSIPMPPGLPSLSSMPGAPAPAGTPNLGTTFKMPGAPAQQPVKAPDDSVNGAITSGLSYASQIPGALGNMIRSSWMDKPQQGKPTAGEQIVSGLNPANAVVNNRPGDPNSGVDWGATGVNTIGQVLGAHEMAPTIEDAISDIHPLNTIKGAAKSAANSANIGLEPHEAITKGLRPSVKDAPQLQKSLPIAAPEIARQHAVTPIDGAQGLADAAHTGANDIYTKEIEPQINRNPNEMINERLPESKAEGMPTAPAQGTIGDSIRAKINPGMERMFPDQARKATAVADMLDRPMTLREASENLKALNAETEGFWKMSPEGRAAVGVTDGLMSAYEDAAAGLREKMAAKLTSLGEVDPGNYRRQYGALKDVQRVAQKRATVVGNQAALNLPQQLTTALGLGEAGGALLSGHPAAAAGGVVAAATPHLLKYLNSTERLIRSGVGGLEAPAAEAFGLRPPPGHMPGAAQGVLPLTPGEHGFNLEPPPGQTPPAPAQQYGLPGIGRGGLDLNVPPQPTVTPPGPTQLPASPLERMKQLSAGSAPAPAEAPPALREKVPGLDRREPPSTAGEMAYTGSERRNAVRDTEGVMNTIKRDKNMPKHPGQINGSSESAASKEALSRAASEKAAGTKRVVVNTLSGQERPLIGPDAVDYNPGPYESVEFRGGKRDGEIIDQGSSARPYKRK